MKCVVTGGCRGLGKSFCLYLKSLGYDVYSFYNNTYDQELFDKGINLLKCDIRNEKDVIDSLTKIGTVDLLINNAAISKDNDYLEKTKDEFMSVLETNLVGTFLVIKNLLNHLNESGIIINISSNNALDCYNPISIDYDASKAGVNILTKDFSIILNEKQLNQKIISICPGWINTDSIKDMNQEYLIEELKRNNQQKLLDQELLTKKIIDELDNYTNGSIIEIKEM